MSPTTTAVSLPAFVCLSVFPHDISKADAARITKPETEMVHHEFGKPIHFGVKTKRSQGTKNCAGVGLHSCECWLFYLVLVAAMPRPNHI